MSAANVEVWLARVAAYGHHPMATDGSGVVMLRLDDWVSVWGSSEQMRRLADAACEAADALDDKLRARARSAQVSDLIARIGRLEATRPFTTPDHWDAS